MATVDDHYRQVERQTASSRRRLAAGFKSLNPLGPIVILLALIIWQAALPFFHLFEGKALASTFTMQTGYYVGDGNTGHAITGLGFQPDLVMLNNGTASGSDGVDWSSSAMPAGTTAKTADADADVTDGSDIASLDSGGFTLGNGADANAAGVRFTYIAFGGSDCSSSGSFCVGSYTGSGSSGKAVSTGFQPDFAWVKRSGASKAVFRTSSMSTNVSQYFTNTAQIINGVGFQSLNSSGFTVGTNAVVNSSGNNYWFAAFKSSSGLMNVGSFTGTGAVQSITGMGFAPDMVIFKNATDSTAQAAGYNIPQSDGNYSSSFNDAAGTIGNITSLDSDGFSLGTTAAANNSGDTVYWVGFGGSTPASGSGNFTMANGTFTGNGAGQSVSGLGFSPDLVIIGTDSQDNAFRTSEMKGDDTAVFSNGTADFSGGITSLDSDGFTIGSSAVTNTSGAVYYWTAFGNAWNPETHGGSANFVIGAYLGSGNTGRSVQNLPFSPDLVIDKSESTNNGNWSNSGMSAGVTQFFGATSQNASGADLASLDSSGFSLGTNANVNKKGIVYNWFAFKDSANFSTGSYTGNGSGKTVSGLGFQPDFVFSKRTTAVVGSASMSSLPTGTSFRFGASSNSTDDFTGLNSDGFTVGSGAEANSSGGTYWYAAWQGKTYGQKDYRLFANQDSDDVGVPLAAQDSSAALKSSDRPFRLRTLLRIHSDGLYAGGANFKLQYAQKSGSCDTGFSGESYADVTLTSPIAYYQNTTPADGSALTADANDPTDGSVPVTAQTYQESNSFTPDTAALGDTDDEWDFALQDNGAPASTAYCLRVVNSDGSLLADYSSIPEIVTSDGAFMVDIVDSGGGSVSSPGANLSSTSEQFSCNPVTGTLGTTSQRVRVYNDSADPMWTLSAAATAGSTALWSDGSAYYDFNDPSGSPPGCQAGGDSDVYAGLLSFGFSGADTSASSGCSTAGLTLGSDGGFQEGVTDALTMLSADSTADMGCQWDLENVGLSQSVPAGQPAGSYSLGLTLTLVAD